MENPVDFYKSYNNFDLSTTIESEIDEIPNFHQLNNTEIYLEPITSSSPDLSIILESQIDETTNLHQVNNSKTYLEPILSSSNKKGIDFVNPGTVSNASNKKVRLPPSIKKGSKDLKLKKRKKKKNKSSHKNLSHNVSTVNQLVNVFGLVERNESSQELTSKPSFPRNR